MASVLPVQDSYSTPVLYAATPFGQVASNIPLKSPADNYFFNGGVDYAFTRDQVLRMNFQGSHFTRGNLGIGAYDLLGRGYTTEDSSFGLFLQQNGPIGRRFVLNTRLSIFGSDSDARSSVEEETVIVNDSFTSGGAQRSGGTHARNDWFNSDLDYVRGTGIAQSISRRISTNLLYSYSYRFALLTGRNINTPVNGTRPDPNFANVVVATSDASGRQHTLNASANVNLGPLPPSGGPAAPGPGGAMIMMRGDAPMMMMMGGPGGPAGTGPRFVWNRGLTLAGFYTYGQNFDNSDGAFVIPSNIFLADQWGPAAFDRRHNWHAAVTSTALRNLSARIGFSGSSAPPLTILTGHDDNGDLVFNDRPDGVGRNSARTVSVYNSSANFGYSFTLGKKTVTSGGGVQIMGGPGGLTVNPTGMQTTPRYRLNLSVNINNLLNRPVYSGFSGNLTSPFFLKPTQATGVRRITFNTNVSF